MSTFLRENIVFGPIHSRRLGCSLGINLLPISKKYCTFNCIYCECGLGDMEDREKFPTAQELDAALEAKLKELTQKGITPDVFTFAGNGEPTLHPEFPQIIEITRRLRDVYFPQAKISVLSNATQIGRPEIREALLHVDNNILKLDSAFDHTMRWMNQPFNKDYNVKDLVNNLKWFHGKLIVQTMFMKGCFMDENMDNTTDEEVNAWIKLIQEIAPQSVMIYTLDRETPVLSLTKASIERLNEIAERLEQITGIKALVAG